MVKTTFKILNWALIDPNNSVAVQIGKSWNKFYRNNSELAKKGILRCECNRGQNVPKNYEFKLKSGIVKVDI